MISIVVVNWNSGPSLGACLRSLERYAPECEVVLVDNASEDESARAIAEAGGRALVVRNATNEGFAAGCNKGWRRSRGDLVLFLNPDAEALEGAVTALAGSLLRHADASAVGGLLSSADGRAQKGFNVRAFPTMGSVAAELLLLEEFWPGNPWSARYHMADFELDADREVDQPAAACLMVRRAALEKLGGFDESFGPAWFEDVDLCRRIHDAGGRIRFEPAARFLHSGGSSFRLLPAADFLTAFHSNQIRYFAKHHGARQAESVRRLVVTGMRLRAGLSWLRPIRTGLSRRQSAQSCWRVARHFARAGAQA